MKKFYLLTLIASASICISCTRSDIGFGNDNDKKTQIKENCDPWLMEDMKDAMTPGHFSPGTANAEYSVKEENVKTHTELSNDASYATVIWDAGDSFTMYAYKPADNTFNYATYTTGTGGINGRFNHDYSIDNGPCYSIYPEAKKLSTYNDAPIFGVNIPISQIAKAGSIPQGTAVALCKTDKQVSDFHFHAAVSFVKFRLQGSVTNKLTEVILKGTTALAGDSILMTEEDGTPTLTREIYFSEDVTSRSVSLNGNFETGKDYYFTVFPGEQSGFSMSFSNGLQTKTLTSANHLPLVRSAISDLGTIDIGDSLEQEDSGIATLYIEATSGKKPVPIAIVPEGFKEEELDDYELLAKSGIDFLFSTEPYKSYKEYFNVWIMKVASKESGSSVTDGEGHVIQAKDTYFASSWGESSYMDMSADLDKVLAFVEDNCPDVTSGMHEAVNIPVLMIVNDTRYGGICHIYPNGRCVAMVPHIDAGGPIYWSYPDMEAVSESSAASGTRAVTYSEKQALGISAGDWRNVLLHEFGGHGFSKLLDEYWYTSSQDLTSEIASHFWTVPYGLNISASYSNPPWKEALLDNLSTLEQMNPLYKRIGVYQGGDISVLNRWRSERVSCMIDNRQYFSTWQRMLIVRRIMSRARVNYDINDFFAKDVVYDPLRDAEPNGISTITKSIPPKIMPMLPGPVFHE